MKKVIITTFFAFAIFVILPISSSIGISDNFKFAIDTIGIPRYNVYGDEINEDIYYTYNVFSYSNPVAMYSKTNTQRFKKVDKYGKWTQNGGPYKGVGVQGEYYVLGTNYSGQVIDNIYFPVDARPTTTPDKWNYIAFDGAYESWFDRGNYKRDEQLEFMKCSYMLFDSDNFRNPPTGEVSLASYGIFANKIGLNKARLNTSSTWKTMGVISTKKKDSAGRIWNAIFSIQPMAASADIKSGIVSKDNVILDENTEIITIPIRFSADAINLTNYAKESHIKEICSTIYINGKEVAKIKDSKTKHIEKTIEFKVDRKEYIANKTYQLQVKVSSYLYTEFSVDGLMQHNIEKTITLQVEPKKIVPVKDSDIAIVQKNNNILYAKPLIKTLVTKTADSKGISEAGRTLTCKLNLNVLSNSIGNIKCYLNNKDIEFDIIKKEGNLVIFTFELPKDTNNTLNSWNYLRNKMGDYFSVNFDEIGNRIKDANILKILLNTQGKDYEYLIKFDSIDNYDINMNYYFDRYILNSSDLETKKELNVW